jgi:hypothetical protein
LKAASKSMSWIDPTSKYCKEDSLSFSIYTTVDKLKDFFLSEIPVAIFFYIYFPYDF